MPLFTKQYKLVPASAGGKVHHRGGVGYAGRHAVDLSVGGQPAPLQLYTNMQGLVISDLVLNVLIK